MLKWILHDYPVIRYGTPNGFYIDIVTRLGKAVSYEDLEYEIIDYQGVKIRIGTPETLYDLKRNTVRQRDRMDAIFLKELINKRKSNHSDEEKSIPKGKKSIEEANKQREEWELAHAKNWDVKKIQ